MPGSASDEQRWLLTCELRTVADLKAALVIAFQESAREGDWNTYVAAIWAGTEIIKADQERTMLDLLTYRR